MYAPHTSHMMASNVAGLFAQVMEETTGRGEPSPKQVLAFAKAPGLHIRPDLVVAIEELYTTGRNAPVPFQGGEWGALMHLLSDFAETHLDA
jgi:hypothetical protein